MGHPPSYEEYLAQRLTQQQLTPPPLPPRNPNMPSRNSTPPPPWTQQQQQQVTSPVLASPTSSISSHAMQQQNFCNCSKCKSRYGTYNDSNGNNDLMFSLDSTPAIQGVLSDGLLCSVM
ncbi:hypothetical protein C0J52_22669 [Blattella germanica]|nr:hypothetical protein C0J52_22669 [Blattella germanica]